MCVILSVYQKNKNQVAIKSITDTIVGFSKSNPDGIGISAYN